MPETSTTPTPKLLVSLLAFAAAILVSLSVAPGATAATPCWQQLVNDYWADNRVDKVYPIRCYREAMAKLPRDVQEYSDVQDDLRRALLIAIKDEQDRGAFGDETGNVGGGGVGGGGGGDGGDGDDEGASAAGAPPPGSDDGGPRGFFPEVLAKLGPSNADSIPVPLLVLGAIALLLVGAAAVSYGARWYQERRVAMDGPPQGPDPRP